MPDREAGSYHYRRGRQSQSAALAKRYRERQREDPAAFTRQVQCGLVRAILGAAKVIELEPYEISTDESHVHLLAGWRSRREARGLRASLKRSMTMALNERFGKRTWFSRGGNVSYVAGIRHFKYLSDEYLPKHLGVKWTWEQGFYD
jgi:hypothetical protein